MITNYDATLKNSPSLRFCKILPPPGRFGNCMRVSCCKLCELVTILQVCDAVFLFSCLHEKRTPRCLECYHLKNDLSLIHTINSGNLRILNATQMTSSTFLSHTFFKCAASCPRRTRPVTTVLEMESPHASVVKMVWCASIFCKEHKAFVWSIIQPESSARQRAARRVTARQAWVCHWVHIESDSIGEEHALPLMLLH